MEAKWFWPTVFFFHLGFQIFGCLLFNLPSRAVLITPVDTLIDQAGHCFQAGAFEEAITCARAALKISGQVEGCPKDQRKKQRELFLLLARSYQSRGFLNLALQSIVKLEKIKEVRDDPAFWAQVLEERGKISLALGHEEEGEKCFQEALALAKGTGDLKALASSFHNQGTLFFQKGQFAEAIDAYASSYLSAQKAKDHLTAGQVRAQAARALLETNQLDEVEPFLVQAEEELQLSSPSHKQIYGLIHIGLSYYLLSQKRQKDSAALQKTSTCYSSGSKGSENDLSQLIGHFQMKAIFTFKEAARLSELIGDHLGRAYALGYYAQLLEEKNSLPEALSFTRRAVLAAQMIKAPECLYLWEHQTGRILRAQGRMDEALVAYRNAVHTFQAVRQELVAIDCPACSSRLFLAQRIEPVYFEIAQVLFELAATTTDPELEQSYLQEARQMIELVKIAELQDYFQDLCLSSSMVEQINLDFFSADTAIIYIIPLAEKVEILVSISGRIKRFSSQVNFADLQDTVSLLRVHLEKRTTRQYLPLAQRLYNYLIRPLESHLAQQTKLNTLVFVPDKLFGLIPMAALHDGQQFLIERFALSNLPSLSLTETHTLRGKSNRVLLAGLTESRRGLTALPFVSQELEAIQKIFPSKVLKNEDFSIQSIEKALQEDSYAVVHLASHCEFKGEAKKTSLPAWDGNISIDHLEHFLKLARYHSQRPVELLILSACRTAAGDERSALGLAGLAVKSGVGSALATLWPVSDQATFFLVRDFYDHWQLGGGGWSKAQALQKAQLSLLKSPQYQHPYYWSPLIMIGNWL